MTLHAVVASADINKQLKRSLLLDIQFISNLSYLLKKIPHCTLYDCMRDTNTMHELFSFYPQGVHVPDDPNWRCPLDSMNFQVNVRLVSICYFVFVY